MVPLLTRYLHYTSHGRRVASVHCWALATANTWRVFMMPRKILKTHYVGELSLIHDDVIKWKHFPRNWPFVRGIHRSPVISPHKGQWRGALMFSLICVWINDWVKNREAGDLRHHRAHCDVIVMHHLRSNDQTVNRETRVLFHYPMRSLIVIFRKVSKPRDLYSELYDHPEIWQAHGEPDGWWHRGYQFI